VHIVETYKELDFSKALTKSLLAKAKKRGFSDKQIADIFSIAEKTVRNKRIAFGITPHVKRIDTMAGEFPAKTSYFYCSYNAQHDDHHPDISEKRVIVLGCGPYAIGTSVEFDWCAVTASQTIRQNHKKSIMVNCNPETVSTDYDMSDYLYFEELTLERVLDICDIEKAPVMVSVGGQIPNNLSPQLAAYGVEILGTRPDVIYRAEHRQQFSKLLDTLGIAQPAWTKANTITRALGFAQKAGYPVLVRPSFVLSGKAMSVIGSEAELIDYMNTPTLDFYRYPLVMTKYLDHAKECDVDGVAQHGEIVVSTIAEHVEGGGVHSGDSTLLLPPVTFSTILRGVIGETTGAIVKALEINGPFNIQFLIVGNLPFVIECNVRSSRSFPFVSKMTGINFVRLATEIALGKTVAPVDATIHGFQSVKAPQFSFHKLREADPVLRVEMGSTGEVCAQGKSPEEAYLKAILSTGIPYPTKKAAFVSLGGLQGKIQGLYSCQLLAKAGFTLYATTGTAFFLKDHGIMTTVVRKIHEGGGMTIMELLDSRAIDVAIVIPEQSNTVQVVNPGTVSDGYQIRRRAVDRGIPVITQVEAAEFLVRSFTRFTPDTVAIDPLQTYVSVRKEHT
jgi:carbamoyl-phosphate synthase large subunit